MAETRLTSSSSTTAAEKKQEADTNHDAAENQELLVYIDTLEQDNDPVNRALSQMASTQVERGAQTVAWTGVVQALLVSSKLESVLERQRLEELQNQLALIVEEKKKQRKGLDGRETVIFEKLVSILGKPLAEQIALKIDKAITGQGAALQKDPAAVAKLSAELLSLLSSGDTLLKLGISPQEAEKALQRCFTTFERSLARSQTAPANSPDPRTSIVGDIVSSARAQPQVTAAQLSTQAGLDLLRAQLAAQSSAEARIELLRSLQGALGTERFAVVLDSYDRLTGRPLVYDCVHLSATAQVDQRKILESLLDPSRSILTAAQLERLSQFAISDAAAIVQTLKIEYSQIPQQITQAERLRIQSYSHLANALGIEVPSGISDSTAHDQCLRAIVEKFPGLAGKTWEEVSKELYTLAGTTDADSLRLSIAKLGASLLPSQLGQKELAGLSESERVRAYERSQAEIKELAVRLLTHMRDISGHEQQLVELRQMLTAGPGQEEAKVIARLESLYSGLISNFSADRVARQGEASRIYIEGLQARIESTTDPVALHGLCTERDSLQWRALQLRIATLLDQKPAAAERVSALLIEFQTAYPPGLRGRRGEYAQAADDVLQALQSTTHYFQEVDRVFSTELQKLQEEQVRLDKLQQEQAGLVKAQEDVVAKYMTSWFNNYKQDKKRLDELKQALHDTEQRQRKVEEDLRRVEVAHKQALAQQIESLAQIGAAGSHTIALASPKDVAAQCRFTKDSAKVQESLQTKLQAADEARTKAQNALARVDLIGHAACTRRDFTPAASATTSRIQQILIHDRTAQPTPAALQALAAAVPAQTSLGKALAAISSSSRPTHELIDLLFARLSAEDVMRVKAFLLAYDRPDLFELVGRDKPSDARAVWSALEALVQNEQKQELSELLAVFPHLRALVDCQELLASQSEGARADALLEYQRIAGVSLGQIVLARAPAGEPGRSNYLFSLCGSPIVTSDDLRALFSGGIVPSEAAERQRVFAESLQRDSKVEFTLPAGFEQLIQQQAQERAGLQVALSSMIQLDRDNDVEIIRRRLAELDSQFYRPLQTILAGYSVDYVARSGIRQRLEGARDAATQMAKMSLLDPYGDLAQDARRLTTIIQREDVSSAQILEFIRESSPSPERMMLMEVMYLQHVSGRPFLGLSGDLRRDLGGRKGATGSDQEQYDRLREGNQSALGEYDLEMLSQGLRTKDPALTGRAILAIQGKELGKDTLRAAIEQSPEIKQLWQDYVASPFSRESVALYNAVMADDQRRIAIIKMVNGLGWSINKSVDAVASLGQYKDEVAQLGGNAWAATDSLCREIYGSPLGQTVASYVGEIPGLGAQAWSGFVSSDVGEQTFAYVAFGRHLLQEESLDPARLAEVISMVPEEYRRTALTELAQFISRIDESATYQDGRSEAILLDYVRRKGGATGEADAALLQAVIAGASGVTPAVPAELVKRYQIERERLISQQEDIKALGAIRGATVDQARSFKDTVGVMDQTSRKDRDSRMFGKGGAQAVVDVHSKMLASQNSLIRGMELGVDDIQSTKEVMRVRAVAILKDLTAAQDRGLTSEQNDRDFGSLRQRDAEREWAVARRDEVKRWQVNAEVAQKALANFDWWFEVGHSSLKVAVIIGLGMVPGVGPLTVLGVATAWNLADKAYKVTYREMSLREATRQFAIEFAIDAVCAGAWKLAVRVPTPWFKHVSQFARDNIVVKNSKILLGKLSGFRPKGEIVNPETFKSIRGFFGQTHLASKVEKLVEKTLTQVNKKIADPLLFAKDVKYSFERIWLSLRPTDLARLAPSLVRTHSPPIPDPSKANALEPDTGSGATTGPRKTNTPTIDIPKLSVSASSKPSEDQIADLLERARDLGKTNVVDPVKQLLDSVDKGDVAGQLSLVENWIRELGVKFSGQQSEVLLQQLQTLVDSIRLGTQDITELYPYVPPLMFLMGVNPAQLNPSLAAQGDDQQKSPHEWEDYSRNFALFDGMFDFLNPGWAGLWIAYKDNAPLFPPPPPPVQPPPPPYYRKPGEQGGSGSGTVPGLTIHVAQDEQKRRPIEIGDAKVTVDPRYLEQAVVRAREQTQELFERRQALNAIEQALQAHRAGVVNAQSIRERVGNVDQNSDQVAQRQAAAIPTMKAVALENGKQEAGLVNSQAQKYVTRQEVATSVAQEAVANAHAVSRRNRGKHEQLEEIDVISVALRSREREVPKMNAAKSSGVEQKSEQQQNVVDANKHSLGSDAGAVDQQIFNTEEYSKHNASRPQIQRIAALRETNEQQASQRLSRAQQLPSDSSGQTRSTKPIAGQDSAREIDASGLVHGAMADGAIANDAPGQEFEYSGQYANESMRSEQGGEGDTSDSEADSSRPTKKKRKNKLQLREEARLRGIIMHQLMTQTLERAKREKLLRMLAALGMTEQEYRAFLTQLHVADAKRDEAAKIQEAQKIALAVEQVPQSTAPTMKQDTPKIVKPEGASPKKTRAELFARLRNQHADKIH